MDIRRSQMGRPKKAEVKPEKKQTKVTRKPRTKKQESDSAPELKRKRGRPKKGAIPSPMPKKEVEEEEEEEIIERLCVGKDCEFHDASFKGNCMLGPVPEGECPSYMLADPIREVPKIESAVIVGHVLQIPMDRDPELVGWIRECSRAKLLMLMLLTRNLLYEQMELDRFIGQETAAVKEERAA